MATDCEAATKSGVTTTIALARVLCFAALAAVASAQFEHGYGHEHHGLEHHGHEHHGHEHGHGFSSQHISRHDGKPEKVSVHLHGDEHGHGHGHGHEHHYDYYAYPKYEFEYKVEDKHTGDHKTQHEHRDGDAVKGFYSLHEPDGSERHVDYHSDKHNGFHATVKHSTHHLVPEHHLSVEFDNSNTQLKMISKVLCFVALVAAVAAQSDQGHGHHHGYSSQHISRHDGKPEKVSVHVKDKHGHEHEIHDYYAYPKYEFEYKVEDKHTGDHKTQHEHRDGDVVKGFYSLHEPDGSERKVDYHSDKHTGFHATVKHSTHHLVPEKHHHHH
ncbi:histidine-rich glycoprotein-like [Ostrinia furnacalis]|uniref:histidine-rich glycoprotein-like n=1 Tax=Ostrinia furnacalis TaxID=93504 RepID=UPI00103C6A89|nr:histidine-rich glycoprotein-like [Ostrinia furnacalis]